MAIWDLAGKALELPVYQLFGGKMRDRVAVHFHASDPVTVRQVIRDTGVKAIKIMADPVLEDSVPGEGVALDFVRPRTVMWPELFAQLAGEAELIEVGRGPVRIQLRQEILSLIGGEIPWTLGTAPN